MATESPLILVVDDQLGVRRLVQEVFREVGYQVSSAANGQEALALVGVQTPALVLLDMKMPVMDGLETLRVLKSLHPALPVFMMTAVGDGDRVSEAMQSGAEQCINKPFDVFDLRKRVAEALATGP
ncbi:MAG TPA: response regulator [Symbiobacteriaceae bacterium]|jgi:two-component system response regulator (stage 0 sporulation protein F)